MVHVEISTKITELLMTRKLLVSAPHSAKYKPIKHLQDMHIVTKQLPLCPLIQLDRGWTRKVEPILKHTDRLVVKYCVGLRKKNTDELTWIILQQEASSPMQVSNCFQNRMKSVWSLARLSKSLPMCVCVGVLYVRWYSLNSVTWNFCNRKPLDKGPSVWVCCCFL